MARVVRIFQMNGLNTEEDAKKVVDRLKGLSGIMRVEAIVSAGVIEVEYENAMVDRYTIKDELSNAGYTLLI